MAADKREKRVGNVGQFLAAKPSFGARRGMSGGVLCAGFPRTNRSQTYSNRDYGDEGERGVRMGTEHQQSCEGNILAMNDLIQDQVSATETS